MKYIIKESTLHEIFDGVISEQNNFPEFMMTDGGAMLSVQHDDDETDEEMVYKDIILRLKADFVSFSMIRNNFKVITKKSKKEVVEELELRFKSYLKLAKKYNIDDTTELEHYMKQVKDKIMEIYSVTEKPKLKLPSK